MIVTVSDGISIVVDADSISVNEMGILFLYKGDHRIAAFTEWECVHPIAKPEILYDPNP